MNLNEAALLAELHMEQHGLIAEGWTFGWIRAKKVYGRCHPARKTIYLSRPLTEVNDETHVEDTILHEIAHALTPGDRHGPKWKRKCVEIGASPKQYDYTGVGADPSYVISTHDGQILQRYFQKPRATTYRKLPRMYQKSRRDETYGKLKILSFKEWKEIHGE